MNFKLAVVYREDSLGSGLTIVGETLQPFVYTKIVIAAMFLNWVTMSNRHVDRIIIPIATWKMRINTETSIE